MAKTAREVVDQAYQALFGRGDLDGFFADFDEDSELLEAESLPYGGRFQGLEAIRKAVGDVLSVYWKDVVYAVDSIAYGDELVIAYGQFNATSIKTGKSVSFPLAEVWKIRGGRVRLIHPVYSDTVLALQALGVEPVTARAQA